MTETEQAQALLNYLSSNVLRRRRDIQLTADSSLVASGLIDSFALVDVLVKLEEVAEMRIPAGKVQPKDMDTVNLMLAMAKRVGRPRQQK
jgi:acyl carrier protein